MTPAGKTSWDLGADNGVIRCLPRQRGGSYQLDGKQHALLRLRF